MIQLLFTLSGKKSIAIKWKLLAQSQRGPPPKVSACCSLLDSFSMSQERLSVITNSLETVSEHNKDEFSVLLGVHWD